MQASKTGGLTAYYLLDSPHKLSFSARPWSVPVPGGGDMALVSPGKTLACRNTQVEFLESSWTGLFLHHTSVLETFPPQVAPIVELEGSRVALVGEKPCLWEWNTDTERRQGFSVRGHLAACSGHAEMWELDFPLTAP